MSGKANNPWGARGARAWAHHQLEERRKQKHELMLAAPPPDWREYLDHYLGRRARLVDFQHALFSLEQFFPCQLVFAALCVHAQRSRLLPPPLPRYMQVQFPALQLQRFLRGCVLATAQALATLPSGCFYILHSKTKSRWIRHVFVRVMSGFVTRAQVQRPGAAPRVLFDYHYANAFNSKLGGASGYNNTRCGCFGSAAACRSMPHAHAFAVCRTTQENAT
jgi:hypothetical protein